MKNQFERICLTFGKDRMEKIFASRVIVFGIGGVGSYVVEALVRSGIGAIDIVDDDTVCLSNINRQLFALHSTLGKNKVDAAEERNARLQSTKFFLRRKPPVSLIFRFMIMSLIALIL